jgi:threonine dehydrogenase-like Zn-dependent dehydrogenase
MKLRTLTIVGVGLIGGSIGLAARKRGLAQHVVGVGRQPATLERARQLGAIDEPSLDLPAAVAQADVAVFCTPARVKVPRRSRRPLPTLTLARETTIGTAEGIRRATCSKQETWACHTYRVFPPATLTQICAPFVFRFGAENFVDKPEWGPIDSSFSC